MSDVSRTDLAELVVQQRAAFMASGLWRYEGEFDHLVVDQSAGSDELLEHVELDPGPDGYRRVSTLILNPVFPAEWRLAACRSYPPEELPSHLQSWASHLDQVRGGDHRDYLQAWYRYATTWQLAQEWRTLRARAAAARDRGNTWASRPVLIDIREQIMGMPLPGISPVPRWGEEAVSSMQPNSDPAALVTLARAWNAHVPKGQKVRITQPAGFDQFLETALNDSALADFLTWIHRAAGEGFGLFLHW